ncbi:nucleotidyl transferase AbiEii/AbiGii toxin family protein [Polyangium spumosum]|uniref:nucleotidyl transferase AbiEii/AbiGii toxin family protein n=1 Tax=Polyangium spumosum TaxID=889282 RepID=UPI00147949D8
MHPLQSELIAILAEARQRSIPLVVLGAFAVRTYLRAPDQRFTHDVDLLALPDALDALGELLTSRGYHVYRSAPWWRAERGSGKERVLLDIASGAVVDMASFESYPLAPTEARQRAEPGGEPIPVPALEDLLAMKILSHRDKDILDVVALLRDAGDTIEKDRFRAQIEARDLELPLRRGYLEIVASIESGELARLWELRTGAPPPDDLLPDAVSRLHDLFR